jgi:hypothetical protein
MLKPAALLIVSTLAFNCRYRSPYRRLLSVHRPPDVFEQFVPLTTLRMRVLL